MPKQPRTSVSLHPETLGRLRGIRQYDEEPLWKVVSRLLDEHDSRQTSPGPTEVAPESKHPIVHAVGEVLTGPFRRKAGREGEAPPDQAAPGVPA